MSDSSYTVINMSSLIRSLVLNDMSWSCEISISRFNVTPVSVSYGSHLEEDPYVDIYYKGASRVIWSPYNQSLIYVETAFAGLRHLLPKRMPHGIVIRS